MSSLMHDPFAGFNIPTPAETDQPSPAEEKQEQISASVRSTSERERKTYSTYREAVSNYEDLVAAKKRAVANVEVVKRQHRMFPEQMRTLQQARDAVVSDRNQLEAERDKQKQGGAGAKQQLRNIHCDIETATLVRSARDDGWMTPNQQAFVQKSTEEACTGNVLHCVENVEKLEKSFKETAVYNHLATGEADPVIVARAKFQLSLYLVGILGVIFLLARLTQWGVLEFIVRWVFGAVIIGAIAYFVYSSKIIKTLMHIAVTAVVTIFSILIYSMIINYILRGSWLLAIVLSLVVSTVVDMIFMLHGGSEIALPLLERLGVMKNSAHREAFRNAESVENINEMLYCYCNHDSIMEFLRSNARQGWIKQLNADIEKHNAALSNADRAMEQLKQKAAQHETEIVKAQAQVSFADIAIQKAEEDIRAWNGLPDLEMGGSTLANHICVESGQSGQFEIIRHDKKPLVIRYQGNPHELSQIGQVEEKMAAVVRAFSKMNPSALIQVTLIAADSGYLRSGPVFQVNNNAAEKYFISGEGDGSIYLVSSASDVMKYQRVFERRIDDLGEFINKRRDQLQGDHSFEKVNELRTANQLPYRYQIILILVPRAKDPDILRDSNLRSYLNPRPAETNGIIPVFFVENNNIHENWKDIIAYYSAR